MQEKEWLLKNSHLFKSLKHVLVYTHLKMTQFDGTMIANTIDKLGRNVVLSIKSIFLLKTIIDVNESMEVNSYKIGWKENLHSSMELNCIVCFRNHCNITLAYHQLEIQQFTIMNLNWHVWWIGNWIVKVDWNYGLFFVGENLTTLCSLLITIIIALLLCRLIWDTFPFNLTNQRKLLT
jgi:hypothetical protein